MKVQSFETVAYWKFETQCFNVWKYKSLYLSGSYQQILLKCE